MRLSVVIICLAAAALALPGHTAPATSQNGKPALSIVDNGPDSEGRQRYSVIADGANLVDLLKSLFAKSGAQFTIAQDVSGTVDVNIKNASIEDILKGVGEAARPPLRISQQGGMYKVARDLTIARIETPPGVVPSMVPRPGGPIGYQSLLPSNRTVTLDVPADRAIPLAQALQQIAAQTGYPISLDRRVSREVVFSGTITQAQLPLVLQTIAETSGLKLVTDGSGAMLVPSDQWLLQMRDITIGAYSAVTCPHCGARLDPRWRFCPNCGQPTQRGTSPINRGGTGVGGYGTRKTGK